MSTATSTPTPGTCYKFTVASADEAAQVIRDRLGEQARVLSVRTVAPSGLRGLWASPKIEVIATVPAAPVPAANPAEWPRPASAAPRLALASADSASPVSGLAAERPAFRPPVAPDLDGLLRRAGFSSAILTRLQATPDWTRLQSLPLHRALVETSRSLQRLARDRRPVAPLTRAAFIGLAGSGRTTALCKWLATEVSRRARVGHVVAVEFDQPVSRGPLPVFCEAMGVPLALFPASTQPATPGGFVYFDLPPISLRDPRANTALATFLDRERIQERVLVLNGAYGPAALRAGYARGRELGATHVVFTHLDELAQWGCLWDYLLDGGLEPLFLATGASLTGECEADVFDALARRTLPLDTRGSDEADEEDAA